jgi:hypothetical protein
MTSPASKAIRCHHLFRHHQRLVGRPARIGAGEKILHAAHPSHPEFYSHLWQLPLTIAQSLNLAAPMLSQNWLTPEDVDNLLRLQVSKASAPRTKFSGPCRWAGLQTVTSSNSGPSTEIALSNFVIARPAPTRKKPSVSVMVAARNEEGNIKNIFERVPKWDRRPN